MKVYNYNYTPVPSARLLHVGCIWASCLGIVFASVVHQSVWNTSNWLETYGWMCEHKLERVNNQFFGVTKIRHNNWFWGFYNILGGLMNKKTTVWTYSANKIKKQSFWSTNHVEHIFFTSIISNNVWATWYGPLVLVFSHTFGLREMTVSGEWNEYERV